MARAVVGEVRPHQQVVIDGVPYHVSHVRAPRRTTTRMLSKGLMGRGANHEQPRMSDDSDSSEEDDARSKTETETDSESD